MPFAPAPTPDRTAPADPVEHQTRPDRRRAPTGVAAIRLKLRVLAAPFAFAIPVVAAACAAITLLLAHRARPVPVEGAAVEFALPLTLAIVAGLALTWRRVQIVKEDRKGNLRFLYHFAGGLALFVPAMVAGDVAIRQAAHLVRLPDATAIATQPDASYLALDAPCLAKAGRRVAGRATRSGGKKKPYVDLVRYVAVPFCPAPGDPGAPAWLALSWSVRLPASASDAARGQAWKELVSSSDAALARDDLGNFAWLEEVGDDRARDAYAEAILGGSEPERDPAAAPAVPLRVLRAHFEAFEAWRGDARPAILAIAIAWAAWCLVALVAPLDAKGCRRWLPPVR